MAVEPYAFIGVAGTVDGDKDTVARVNRTQDLRWNGDGSLLYVLDYEGGRVRIVTPATNLVSTLADSIGRLFHPEGMDVLPNGDVWVGDQGNARVVKFLGGSTFATAWSGAASTGGAVRYCPADDRIYYNDGLHNLVGRNQDGTGAVTLRSDFSQIEGVAFVEDDGSFDVLVCDFAAGLLVRVDRDAPYSRTTLLSGLAQPEGIDVDGPLVYFAERGSGEWMQYNLVDESLVPVATTADGLSQPSGCSIRNDGVVFLADFGASRVFEFRAPPGRWAVGSIAME